MLGANSAGASRSLIIESLVLKLLSCSWWNETVKEIGNSISDMIKLTADYPSKNPSGRVAMLDVQLLIERDEEGYQQLRFSHFEKEMKNKFVIMKDSAYEESRKRTILTQETIAYENKKLTPSDQQRRESRNTKQVQSENEGLWVQ